MVRAVPGVAAMAAYALADPGPAGTLSLAQNESAFPVSPEAIEAGRRALGDMRLYPDPDWSSLRAAIGAAHAVDPDGILCGAGSMELIGCVIRAFAGPGDEVLAPAFGYLFVETACRQSGAEYRTVAEERFTISTAALARAVSERTRIVFLCNPGNPTGTSIPNSEIAELRARLPADVLLVVDQAYGEFDDQDPRPVFDLVAGGATVVLRSFSKAYGLAGARVGWGLFPPAVQAEVRKLLNPNNVSAVSQAMAVAAVMDEAHMRTVVARTAEIRDDFIAKLRRAGYDIPQSRTNFVLLPFASPAEARAADAKLRASGFLLRGMGGYGLAHCLRATIVAGEAMNSVAEILASLTETPV